MYLGMLQISLPLEEERRWSAGSSGVELILLKQMKQNCILEVTAVDSQININCIIDGLSLVMFSDVPYSPFTYAKNFPTCGS